MTNGKDFLKQLSTVGAALALILSAGWLSSCESIMDAINKPFWAKQETILEDAYIGQEDYRHTLTEGVDFWASEGNSITKLVAVQDDDLPSWLTVTQSTSNPKKWILGGQVTDTTSKDYSFRLRAKDKSGETDREVVLHVATHKPTQYESVQIRATPNTNYGIGEVATMTSEVQTAPDSLTTYQVAIDVTPPSPEQEIVSGASGGAASNYSWGIGDGSGSKFDKIFNGDDNDWVGNVGNITLLNFNANGSTLSESDIDIVFESITLANAQSPHDTFKIDFKNGVVRVVNIISSKVEVYNFGIESATPKVTDFIFGTADTGKDSKNKWSVEGINVRVAFVEK